MSKSLRQQLMVLVMLVAFLGQAAMAGTIHCVKSAATALSTQSTIANENAEQEHCVMALSMAEQDTMPDQPMNMDENASHCCDNPQCNCPAANHSSTTLLFSMTTMSVLANTDIAAFTALQQHPVAVSSSLYRPPISA